MARFDVYHNPSTLERRSIPFFLDIQNDHIKAIQSRVVVPLWHVDSLPGRFAGLNPEFEFQGQTVVMDTPTLGAVPISALKGAIGNLAKQQLVIQDALDTLFGGY
jgi:toxin CcdB